MEAGTAADRGGADAGPDDPEHGARSRSKRSWGKVCSDVAVTGEITLHGNNLAVGGLARKIAAARDAGVRVVIVPKNNEREVREFPPDVYRGLRLVFVEKAEEAFEETLI